MYYPTSDAGSTIEEAEKDMKNVDGITHTSVVLDDLQPNTTYSIQVAVRMSGDVVGSYSIPESGKEGCPPY